MIEVSKPKIEEATAEDIKEMQSGKISFPIAAFVVIGVLVLLIVACIIVLACLGAF